MDTLNLQHVQHAWTGITFAIKVINDRLLRTLALVMTFALFLWAMIAATWLHFAVAGSFGVLIFLPILFATSRRLLERYL